MASALLKLTDVQLGVSGTTTNNFTMYQPSTPDGTVRWGVGNSGSVTDIVTLNSSGYVGIGTSSPTAQLQINRTGTSEYTTFRLSNSGASGKTFEIGVGGNTAAAGYANSLYFYDSTAGSLRMALDSSGNLGLGVTPSSSLGGYRWFEMGAKGSGVAGGPIDALMYSNAYYSSGWKYADNYHAGQYEIYDGQHLWKVAPTGTAGNAITFTQAMTLDASGNLGVGTASPGYRLDVQGGYLNIDASYWLKFGGNNTIFSSSAVSGLLIQSPSGAENIIFRNSSGTERMRIDTSGNLLVGATTMSGWGTASPKIRAQGGIQIADYSLITEDVFDADSLCIVADSTENICFGGYITASSTYTERMRIDTSGNLLVNTTTQALAGVGYADCYLSIVPAASRNAIGINIPTVGYVGTIIKGNTSGGSYYHSIMLNGSNTKVGEISVSSTGTTYTTSSDYRLKNNIQPLQNALGVVAQLKPVTYTWKADGSDGQGFIAHELQAVVPDCVTGEKDAVDEEGNPVYQGIDTSFLVATLTAAIQEQQAIIESLTQRIEQLEAK